jgi:hypothetical protein
MTLGGAPVADLDSMLRDAGVPVVINGISGYGIPRQSSADGVSGEVGILPGSSTTVVVRSDVFTGIAQNVTATVNGKDYRIITFRLLPSGLTRIYLIDL